MVYSNSRTLTYSAHHSQPFLEKFTFLFFLCLMNQHILTYIITIRLTPLPCIYVPPHCPSLRAFSIHPYTDIILIACNIHIAWALDLLISILFIICFVTRRPHRSTWVSILSWRPVSESVAVVRPNDVLLVTALCRLYALHFCRFFSTWSYA